MDGCLYFLIMALLLGQSLPMVLAICWRLLLGLALHACSLIGVCLRSLMLLMLCCGYVKILMCGLMVALFLTRSLVPLLKVLGLCTWSSSVCTESRVLGEEEGGERGRGGRGGEGFILALQASELFRLFTWEVDNLNAVGHVGRLLDGVRSSCLAELLNDGDLIMLVDRVLEQMGRDTVRVTKVKLHADAQMVRVGQLLELDRFGSELPTVGERLIMLLLMHFVTCLVSVDGGILLSWSYIVLYCYFPCCSLS